MRSEARRLCEPAGGDPGLLSALLPEWKMQRGGRRLSTVQLRCIDGGPMLSGAIAAVVVTLRWALSGLDSLPPLRKSPGASLCRHPFACYPLSTRVALSSGSRRLRERARCAGLIPSVSTVTEQWRDGGPWACVAALRAHSRALRPTGGARPPPRRVARVRERVWCFVSLLYVRGAEGASLC